MNVEAGDYIQDDPVAWAAIVTAVNRYGKRYASLHEQYGEDAADILAGTLLSYLASEHGVYVSRLTPAASDERIITIPVSKLDELVKAVSRRDASDGSLDVDTLARAMRLEGVHIAIHDNRDDEAAEIVAAEYARLSESASKGKTE